MTSPQTPAPHDPPATAEPGTPEPAGAEPAAEVTPPPLPWLLAYRVLGLRLPREYRPWVARDVATKLFLTWRIARTYLWFLVLIGLVYGAISAIHQPPSRTRLIQMLLITLAVSLLSSGTTLVRRTLRWQRVDRRGRPVRPKGLAVLGNAEAVVAGALVLVLVAAGAGVFGYTLRPTGINAAQCLPPDAETVDRLRSGFKSQDTKIQRALAVEYQGLQVVVAALRPAGADADKPGVFVIQPDGKVFEVPTTEKPEEALTTFPRPEALDRGVSAALIRLGDCQGRRRS